jgi:hypothetical protein
MTKANATELSGLFYIPKTFPERSRFRELSRALLNPGERIVIETPDQRLDLSLKGLHAARRYGKQWTVKNALRLTVYSNDPAQVLGLLRKELKLRTRRPRRDVSMRDVERYFELVETRPQVFTRGSVNAQLDSWGRAAIPHLNKLESLGGLYSGYLSYAMRYLLESFPSKQDSSVNKNELVRKGGDLLRYGVKRLDEEGGIAFNGWPRRPLFTNHISVFVLSGIELVCDWHKEELLERSMDGLEHGGLVLTKNSWPGVKMQKFRRHVIEVKGVSDANKLSDISMQHSVHLRPLKPDFNRQDDFTLIARAVQILLDRRPFTEEKSFGPKWWRLRADPFGRHAMKNLIPQLFSRTRFSGGALRLFNADRWIGMERDIILMLATAKVESSPNSIWGLAVDADSEELAREIHKEIESLLNNFGRPVDGPPAGHSVDVEVDGSEALRLGLAEYNNI